MKRQILFVFSILLMAVSPIVCFESAVRLIEIDEKEVKAIAMMKKFKESPQDSLRLKNYRAQFLNESEQNTVLPLYLFVIGVVSMLSGVVLFVWSMRNKRL